MKYSKYLLYILLILMIPTSAFASMFQTSKTVVCGSTEMLMEGLKKIGETDITLLGSIDGNVPEGDHFIATLHRSIENGTFSVVESSSGGISCMISSGRIVPPSVENETEPKSEDKTVVPNVIPDRGGGTKTLWQKRSGIAIKFQVSQ